MKKLLFAVATIAAGLVFADFSPDTLAFYPFTDGAAGDSANGVTLKNAVAPGTNDAVSVQYDYPSTAAKGVIRFDDDVPGSYLFDDVTLALPDPVCSHLRSILITTDVTDASQAPDSYAGGSGGYISLPDISTELSKCGTSGFTVEFFWKIPTEEPYPCTWAAALTLDVGITDAGGTNRKVSVAFPVGGPDVAHGRYLSVFTSPWGSYADYGAPISYGEWHHLALTFTSGVFKVVGDYTATASISGLTVSEIQTAKEIKLGMRYDNAFAGFHGKIAGLRFSKRPLAVSEYLKASDRSRYRNVREPDLLTVDTNTVAFYSFKEGAGRVGEQTGDAVMLNDVSNNYPGVSAKAGGVFPAYSDDAPGPYVFVGYGRDKTAFCTNAMSLSFGGGKVDFEGIGTALSELDESTIEFFWKMAPDEAIVGWKATMAWDGGYLRNGASYPLSLIIPLADQTSQYGREIRLVRQGKVSEYDGFIIVRTYADLPEDGLWHHIAVTYKNGEVGLYADYSKVGAVGGFTRAELAGSVPFQLGLGNYRGKIACLRVSKKALDPSGMIYASSDPSCYPSKTLIRLRLDGTVGANADSTNLPNIAPSYTDVNPGIFAYGTQSFPAIDRANGSTAGPAGVFPVFSASKWWTKVCESAAADPLDNLTSVQFSTVPKTSGSEMFASGPSVRVYSALDETMTVEAFVKFDFNGFWSHIGSLWNETRDRVTLLAESKDGGAKWNLQIADAKSETGSKIKLETFCTDNNWHSASWTIGSAIRNKWHHFAVIYDKENLTMTVYCDYEQVINLALPAPLALETCNMFSFAGGANNQPFDGWIDEYRVTRGILGVDEFLRPEGRLLGTTLQVR